MATAAASRSVCEETCSEPSQDTTAKDKIRKMYIKVFTEKLVSQILRKTKVGWTTGNPEATISRLFERTWTKVEGVDFGTSWKTFQNLDKAILQDLYKKWGCADHVLVSMYLEEPALINCTASLVKDHLMTPPKKFSTISRFLSSVGKAISNICRCRTRFGCI